MVVLLVLFVPLAVTIGVLVKLLLSLRSAHVRIKKLTQEIQDKLNSAGRDI